MITEERFGTGEVTLSYLQGGDPHGVPLVLLHGISLSRQTWLPIMPHLGAGYRVIAPDLRGHGDSSTGARYAISDYARDVARLLAARVHRPAVIMGHSLGALVATLLAEHAVALILEDPPFGPHDWEALFEPAHQLAAMGDEAEQVVAALPESLPDNERRHMAARLAALDPDALRFVLEDRLEYDMEAILPTVTRPVLLLQGDMGGALRDEQAAQARDLLPDVRFHRMMGVGHTAHATHMPDVLRLVQSFLAKVVE